MSPFAHFLLELRKQRRLNQREFAAQLGYEQTYISALERSRKGPPRPPFIERLIKVLNLTEAERQALTEALHRSKRQLTLPCEASLQEYDLIRALEPQLGQLTSTQIEIIKIALLQTVAAKTMTEDARRTEAGYAAQSEEMMT